MSEESKEGLSYASAGVNKEEGYKTVDSIKAAAAKTHNSNVLNGLGSFGAFYALTGYRNPVLVSGTDGVGTKLRIALDVKKYDTVGIDCFAMCANDVLCHGAKPLFFLDYLACGKLDAQVAAEIISGVAKACEETGCALIGGETAEMPGMYALGDYDIAGFCVGAVEHDTIIDGSAIRVGDALIALPSSGFHSNGFSLIRKVFTDFHEEWNGKPLFEELLIPTKLYHNLVFALLETINIKGIAHITGGGLLENLPRIIPNGLCAEVSQSAIQVPEIMQELQQRANISQHEMFGTFNMGVGMVLVVAEKDLNQSIQILSQKGEKAFVLGRIIPSDQEKIQLV